jgi:hypothetical protein
VVPGRDRPKAKKRSRELPRIYIQVHRLFGASFGILPDVIVGSSLEKNATNSAFLTGLTAEDTIMKFWS